MNRLLELALIILLLTMSIDEAPGAIALKAQQAQEFVDDLRTDLKISNEVEIAIVVYHPLVFSVEPTNQLKDRFLLSMELGFLLMLNDDELRAALAHELGHVWIYTHHPFLQTERMANVIGQRVANTADFESVYLKLWAYEGTAGVPLDDLLARKTVKPEMSPQTGEPNPLGPAITAEPQLAEDSGLTVWAKGFKGQLIEGMDGNLYEPYGRSTIEYVQTALMDRGLYAGPVNGVLDRPTMKSILAFQVVTEQLQLCGVPTPHTRKMLQQGSHTDVSY